MCGLPQLTYQADSGQGVAQPERRPEPVRDAASIAWKPATRLAASLAVPAGILLSAFFLYSVINESSFIGLLFLMAAAAAWVVALYMRSQKPAWITIGAGARLGLVTGIFSSWTATAMCGLILFGARYWFNYGKALDGFWNEMVNKQLGDVWAALGVDPKTTATLKTMMLSSQGRAEGFLIMICELAASLLLFSIVGGALGARFLARPRRPQI